MKQTKILIFSIISFLIPFQSALAETGALWGKSTTTASDESRFYSVALANDSSIYAAGKIEGTGVYNFGDRVVTTGDYSSGSNVILVKYDDTGKAVWAKSTMAGPAPSTFESVAIDNNNDAYYAAGHFWGTSTFDFGNAIRVNGNYTSSNPLLIKYDSSGNAKWAKTAVVSPNSSYFYGTSTDSSGNIYAGGLIYGTGNFDFGNGVTVNGSYSTYNPVLVKYDSSGNAQWAKSTISSSEDTNFKAIATDNSGNTYAVAYLTGNSTYDFGNGITVSGSSLVGNIVIVKYDTNGNTQWARSTINSSGSSYPYSVTVDTAGNAYVAGYIYDNTLFDFGNGVTVTGGYISNNPVLVKYNSSGDAQWARSSVSALKHSVFYGVAVDSDGNAYATGYISGTDYYNFGNGVTVTGKYQTTNPILVKYDSNGNTLWAKTTVDATYASSFRTAAANNKEIFAIGYIYGNNTYDFGNNVKPTAACIGEPNACIIKYGTVIPSSSSSSSSNISPNSSSSSAPSPVVSAGSKSDTKLSTLLGIGAAVAAAI